MLLPHKPDYYDAALSFSLAPVSGLAPKLLVNGLVTRALFSLPNPFAVITTDGSGLRQSAIFRGPSRPIGTKHSTCCVTMFFSFLFRFLTTLTSLRSTIRESSNIQAQVFDQRKFKRNEQCFLRSVPITVGDVLNHNQGGTSMPHPPFFSCDPSHSHICIIPTLVIQNLELQLGPDGQIVYGNLVFLLATKDQESSRASQPPQQLLPSLSTICAHPVRRLQQIVPATNYQTVALSRQSHHTVAKAV